MRYVEELMEGNVRSLVSMFEKSIAGGHVTEEDFRRAIAAESKPLTPGANVHQLSLVSEALIARIMKSPDRNMIIILKKILKSTRYAVVTYYNVTGQSKSQTIASV